MEARSILGVVEDLCISLSYNGLAYGNLLFGVFGAHTLVASCFSGLWVWVRRTPIWLFAEGAAKGPTLR